MLDNNTLSNLRHTRNYLTETVDKFDETIEVLRDQRESVKAALMLVEVVISNDGKIQ